jgi:hypothetical protein
VGFHEHEGVSEGTLKSCLSSFVVRNDHAVAGACKQDDAERCVTASAFLDEIAVGWEANFVLRHASFSTTEKHYGAIRTAQNAAAEIVARMKSSTQNSAFVGGLGSEASLTLDEISALKSLLAKL